MISSSNCDSNLVCFEFTLNLLFKSIDLGKPTLYFHLIFGIQRDLLNNKTKILIDFLNVSKY